MGKIENVLDVLACMDWLTPLLGLLDSSTDAISVRQEEIWAVDALKRKGIRVKRVQTMPFGRLVFEVPKEQTRLAVLLLRQMGLSV